MVPNIRLKIPYPGFGGLELNGKLASGFQSLLAFFRCHFRSAPKHGQNGLTGAVQ